ncbi:hypothetical protein PS918_00525 [Pseudomonas fluorescens]|uniref:DUF6285 domain-containing protein n=1 Tax=Pseudomonas fluorescens TaxID=294 RepID=A0A5E7QZ84_PSEFL|nr:DUF6285 domain-containing protein [Pseudomonas fluorescens]VVP67159.1 hypothetical protein PS918_00525 [Pseudomonas fluorescens]
MTDPNAVQLMETARDVLLKQLMPALPEGLRYECRMIASAMAMAAREIDLATTLELLEEQRLADVLGIHSLAGLTPQDARALLSQFIRQGLYDPPGDSSETLLRALSEITRTRLAISNPKVVADERPV